MTSKQPDSFHPGPLNVSPKFSNLGWFWLKKKKREREGPQALVRASLEDIPFPHELHIPFLQRICCSLVLWGWWPHGNFPVVDLLINVQFAHAQEGLPETQKLISPEIMLRASYLLRVVCLHFCYVLCRGDTEVERDFLIPRSLLATGEIKLWNQASVGMSATTLVSRTRQK